MTKPWSEVENSEKMGDLEMDSKRFTSREELRYLCLILMNKNSKGIRKTITIGKAMQIRMMEATVTEKLSMKLNRIVGKVSSAKFWSLENLFRIRPEGFAEKNPMGACTSDWIASLWMLEVAWRQNLK